MIAKCVILLQPRPGKLESKDYLKHRHEPLHLRQNTDLDRKRYGPPT
jgi:hypothetical protein